MPRFVILSPTIRFLGFFVEDYDYSKSNSFGTDISHHIHAGDIILKSRRINFSSLLYSYIDSIGYQLLDDHFRNAIPRGMQINCFLILFFCLSF